MNNVCPLDFRYGREEIRKIFSEESRLLYQLKVEAALARAHAKLGNIPQEAAEEITRKANLENVKLERVKEIEKEIHHDVMAMVKALTEVCGDAGRYIHLGATSYDIVDSANAIQMAKAMEIIENLEKKKRGIYGGAVGYMTFSGDMDVCIAIRTIIKKNSTVFLQAGAGIVADSIPEHEYLETISKANGLLKAVEYAEGGLV